jgi:CheY-like chemotaxis protein
MTRLRKSADRRGDRRCWPRVHVGGSALIHAPEAIVRCEITNLSARGALLRPSLAPGTTLAPGTVVSVDLHLIGSRSWIGQRGRVRRCAGRGAPLAIVFDQVSPEFEDLVEDEVLDELEAARSPRVLVVDRDDQRRGRAAAALRSAGCSPLEASTPLEAIELVEDCHDHLAAAAIAIDLTQTGGRELAQFLADTHPGIRVAILVPARGRQPRPARGRRRDPIVVMDEQPEPDWSATVRQLLGRA